MRRQPLFELSTPDPGFSDSFNPGVSWPTILPRPQRGGPTAKFLPELTGSPGLQRPSRRSSVRRPQPL